MRNHTLLGASGLFLLTALAACGGSTSTPPSDPSIANPPPANVPVAQSSAKRDAASSIAPAALTNAVVANNAFALDLYARQVAAQSAPGNVILSPLSASLALTMTYAGSAGETQTQMAAALHVGSPSTIFDGQNALSQGLDSRAAAALATLSKNLPPGATAPATDDLQLQVINSVWGQKTFTWKAPFLDTLARSYGAGVYEENFETDSADALTAINGWVASATANKIQNLLDSTIVNAQTRLVLVNAIHLKFPWTSPFAVSATTSQTFTRADGTTVSVPMMNQVMDGATYADDGAAQVIELPLADQQLVVEIALPHGDLATYEAQLSATSGPIARPHGSGTVSLALPKVSFTSDTFSLKGSLQGMGMLDAFDATKADFSGMTGDDQLYIGDVEQKAMVAMEENGVEAAAATAVGVLAGSAPINAPIPMNVNKPFVLSILDATTGAVLFLGHIVDPTVTGAQ